jgi:hypothetical protein
LTAPKIRATEDYPLKAPVLHVFQMESCVMHKFEISIWGIKVSAQGLVGITAAVVVVGMILAVYRW